jgi:hypothetical protein
MRNTPLLLKARRRRTRMAWGDVLHGGQAGNGRPNAMAFRAILENYRGLEWVPGSGPPSWLSLIAIFIRIRYLWMRSLNAAQAHKLLVAIL